MKRKPYRWLLFVNIIFLSFSKPVFSQSPGSIGSNQSICAGQDPAAFTSVSDATAASDPTGAINCYPASGTITVNGSLSETSWNISRTVSKTVIGSSNNTTTFGVLWDNTNLYIGVKVLDGSLRSNATDYWNGDAVEVFIDANNNKLSSYDGKDNQFIKAYNQSGVYSRVAISGLQHAWASISGGYSVEFAIPWSQLGITPAAATSIGFDIAVDDDDNGSGRSNQNVWNGIADNYLTTANFGTLTLRSSAVYYQWESSSDNTNWSSISGATSSTYDAPVLASTTYYRRKFTDNYTNSGYTSSVVVQVGTNGTLTLSSPSIPTAGNLCANSTNNQIYRFSLAASGSSSTPNQISFVTTGSASDADISNFKLYYNSSNNFPGGSPIATITNSKGAGTHTFSNLSTTIASGNTGYFWITADIPASPATDATLSVSAMTTGNISASCTTLSGSTSAGNTQTIRPISGSISATASSPSATNHNPVYYGTSVTLSASASGSGTFSYSWSSVPSFFTGTSSSSTATLTPTTNTVVASVVITNSYSCSATVSFTETVSIPYSTGLYNPPPATGYAIPGAIYAYNYNTGTANASSGSLDYADSDATNNGGQYRTAGSNGGGVDIEAGGSYMYDVGWTNGGEFLAYTVNIAAAGYYNIIYNLSNGGATANTPFKLQLDGVDIANSNAGISIPGNGWGSYADYTITSPVYIGVTGIHTLKLVQTSGSFNITRMVFASANIVITSGAVFTGCGTQTITAVANPPSATTVTSVQFSVDGASIGTDNTSPYSMNWTSATHGDHTVTALATFSNGSTAVATQNVTVTYRIYSTSAAPSIDGAIDALWSDYTSIPITKVALGVANISSSSDLSATIKVARDASNFYLLLDVNDDDLKNDGGSNYENDGMELHIDMGNNKGTSYGANDFQYGFTWNNNTVVESKHNATTGVIFAQATKSGGYIMEISIPWTTLGGAQSDGTFIGFDPHINDDDGGGSRDSKITFNDITENAWQNPSYLGTLELGPMAPTATGATACSGSIVTLNASGSSSGYKWYAASSGGSSLAATSSYTTPTLNSTTTYYVVSVASNSCESSPRTAVIATINTTPPQPSISAGSATTFCSGGSVTLTSSTTSGTYQWYKGGVSINGASNSTYTATTTGTYTVIVTSSSNCPSPVSSGTSVTVNPTGQWLGISTDWNSSSNWCGGIPTSTTDAIIPSGTSNDPQITVSGAVVNNLTINSAATLTLLSGNTLNVKGNFSNNGSFVDNGGTTTFTGSSSQTITGTTTFNNVTINNSAGVVLSSNVKITGTLTLTSGALTSNGKLTVNLSTGEIDKSGTGSVTGTITVERSASDAGSGWHYIGSPLGGATFSELNDNIPLTSNNFYFYQESKGSSNYAQRWSRVLAAPFSYPMSTTMSGQKFTGGPSDMNGYALIYPGNVLVTISGTYTHGSGTSFTTGNMSYTSGGAAATNGWHLIANPYPSYIDWNSQAITKSNVEAGIGYFNNAVGANATYLPASGAFSEASTNGGSPYIPPMQAFWVQVTSSGNGSVTVANNARITNPSFASYPTAPIFYKTTNEPAKSIKLSARNTNGGDEIYIRFGEGATKGCDKNYDMIKINNNNGLPNISSVTDSVQYVVNSLPLSSLKDSIEINFPITSNGTYTISLKELANANDIESVILYDRITGQSQDLMDNETYTFTASKTDRKDRFIILFKEAQLTSITDQSSNLFVKIPNLSTSGKITIEVLNNRSDKMDIVVTDLSGRVIYESLNTTIAGDIYECEVPTTSSSMYVVQVSVDGKFFIEKVFIRSK